MSRVRSQGFVSRLAWWQGVWRALASLHSLGFDDEPEISYSRRCMLSFRIPAITRDSLAAQFRAVAAAKRKLVLDRPRLELFDDLVAILVQLVSALEGKLVGRRPMGALYDASIQVDKRFPNVSLTSDHRISFSIHDKRTRKRLHIGMLL